MHLRSGTKTPSRPQPAPRMVKVVSKTPVMCLKTVPTPPTGMRIAKTVLQTSSAVPATGGAPRNTRGAASQPATPIRPKKVVMAPKPPSTPRRGRAILSVELAEGVGEQGQDEETEVMVIQVGLSNALSQRMPIIPPRFKATTVPQTPNTLKGRRAAGGGTPRATRPATPTRAKGGSKQPVASPQTDPEQRSKKSDSQVAQVRTITLPYLITQQSQHLLPTLRPPSTDWSRS